MTCAPWNLINEYTRPEENGNSLARDRLYAASRLGRMRRLAVWRGGPGSILVARGAAGHAATKEAGTSRRHRRLDGDGTRATAICPHGIKEYGVCRQFGQ